MQTNKIKYLNNQTCKFVCHYNSFRDILNFRFKFEKFKKDFVVADDLLDQIKAGAENEKIKFDEKQFEISKDMIKLQIKALANEFTVQIKSVHT